MATISKYQTSSGTTLYRVRYRTPENRQTDKRGFTTKRGRRAVRRHGGGRQDARRLRRTDACADDGRPVGAGVAGPPAWAPQTLQLPGDGDRVAGAGRSALGQGRDRRHQADGGPAVGVGPEPRCGRRYTRGGERVEPRPPRVGVDPGRRRSRSSAGGQPGHRHQAAPQEPQASGLPDPPAGGRTGRSRRPLRASAAAAGLHRPALGEAVGLRVRDLDMLRRRATISENAVQVGQEICVGTPKAHKRRSVPLPEFLLPYLALQCDGRDRDDLLFPARMADTSNDRAPTGGSSKPSPYLACRG